MKFFTSSYTYDIQIIAKDLRKAKKILREQLEVCLSQEDMIDVLIDNLREKKTKKKPADGNNIGESE